jgi:hypothetical protein
MAQPASHSARERRSYTRRRGEPHAPTRRPRESNNSNATSRDFRTAEARVAPPL